MQIYLKFLAEAFLVAVTGLFAEAFMDIVSVVVSIDFSVLELSVQSFVWFISFVDIFSLNLISACLQLVFILIFTIPCSVLPNFSAATLFTFLIFLLFKSLIVSAKYSYSASVHIKFLSFFFDVSLYWAGCSLLIWTVIPVTKSPLNLHRRHLT